MAKNNASPNFGIQLGTQGKAPGGGSVKRIDPAPGGGKIMKVAAPKGKTTG